ncbi:S8/S53 family peptidase [Actinospica durhamensis]|uniref:S8/S53 family peptidase n=1 Tax=Actinospica durhamensis TaxID=1508375 RepID=A0A941ENE3_9ACTN|nr:S53 family peptidase [Actinospica durhamensis]MBR7834261.1 S8/S53 family peptidase [Actinospica durhamensis]
MQRSRHKSRATRSALGTLAVVTSLVTGVLTTPPASADSATARTTLVGTRPAWASSSSDAGAVPADTTQSVRVYLAGSDPGGLAAYALDVSTPGNADYRRYLTPLQFEARFGPTSRQITTVEGWLADAGLRVTATNSHYVAASGSGSDIASAFDTAVHRYRTAEGIEQAPASAVSVPAALAPDVLTVSGLTTSTAHMTGDVQFDPVGSDSASANVGACSAYDGQDKAAGLPLAYGATLNWDMCGYTPAQLRSAYGVAGSGLTGRGVTIAVVDEGSAPTLEQDLDTYSQTNGLPQLRPGQFTESLPSDIATSCPAGPSTEAALDVDAVHTMAPGADLVYVGADCGSVNDDTLDAETRIVDGRLADIVSNSWHLGTEDQIPPDLIAAFDRIMEQGAAEGIGFYFSAGDNGDWSSATAQHTTAVQYPASDPWATSVGGTSLAVGRSGQYLWETGWGSLSASLSADGGSWSGLPGSFVGGSGGGRSTLFDQPAYQRGVVPDRLSAPAGEGTPMREIPDLAADADPDTGMLIGITLALPPGSTPQYLEGRAGGTSLATPLIAGIQADAEQAEGGVPLGFANPAIYLLYRSRAFHDVTDYPQGSGVPIAMADESRNLLTGALSDSVITFGQDESLTASPGYDDVTGVGTPTSAYLDSYRAW